MANNTFVGFNLPTTGQSSTQSEVVKELQPVTTWSRDGNYKVTRRWRGPIDSLIAFSNGGSTNADFAGTYFTGTSGILLGGAGRDGALTTEIVREEGGQIGVFSATWVTSNIAAAQWTGAPTAPATRGATTGDQFQESSLWTLDGNDLEKDVYSGMVMEACEDALKADTAGTQFGFVMRVKKAIADYNAGTDADGNSIPDYFDKAFDITDYFGSIADHPLSVINAASSVMGLTTLLDDLKQACSDILRGQESFTISQYVLRNTKTTQYTSSIAAHLANTNRVWTTANIKTLMAAETRTIDPPTSVTNYDIPLLGVLGSSGIFDTSKWLYRTPDIQELNNGKWQITKEFWEGADISLSTYKAYA
tara:strand:- start:56 stop:1144 length:1089 start_codon:yes stop_codon:yes gene_type:complete